MEEPRNAPLELLFDGRLEEYFVAAADRPECVWVFQHIPKTAGSSFGSEMASMLTPAVNVAVGQRRTPGGEFPNIEAAFEHHWPQIRAGKYRYVRGHLPRRLVERMRRRPGDIRAITMLRDPVERVLSSYRYLRTPTTPQFESAQRRFPDLEAFVASRTSHNVMFKFLRRGEQQSVDDVIADVEASYAFVGLTESYEASRQILYRLLGSRPRRAAEKNRSAPVGDEADAVRTLLPMILRTNRRDLHLYEHFRRRFASVRPEIDEHLAS